MPGTEAALVGEVYLHQLGHRGVDVAESEQVDGSAQPARQRRGVRRTELLVEPFVSLTQEWSGKVGVARASQRDAEVRRRSQRGQRVRAEHLLERPADRAQECDRTRVVTGLP